MAYSPKMKVVFLCGSLEPGCDGVGDYTRRLAGEIIRQGHQATIVALYDKYLNETYEGRQEDEGISISVLRITANLSTNKCIQRAKIWIEDSDPMWISLQFVPFAFHPKGLPFKLSSQLRNIWKGRLWHVMFHELWVGMEVTASTKLVWWGRLQRYMIKSLVADLKPCVIHTQTQLYQTQLARLGFHAAYLPLFGNIPVVNSTNLMTDKKKEVKNYENKLVFVLFGAIHPGVPVKQLAEEVSQYSKKHKSKLILQLAGRNGAEQERWMAAWKNTGLEVEMLGEQSPEKISEIFQNASLGISTTPLALLEKSGSVAAMREHGLSVLCVRQTWKAKGISNLTPLSGILTYHVGNLEECLSNLSRITVNTSLQATGTKFVDDLITAKNRITST
ncbi:glycosyltransferase family protein [Catalinimonas niigatensis]|uniref:hypothetical protein n=1 Tax=Catalinimonas niigatensis TaxID=1397264 RepID=UPI002665BE30|nr:hypothetical protein [Catalinimonas niigatensis]WPP52902.1 hypothetical protein PZB72_10995 [Catalinimonas niigatensis]